MLQTTRLGSLYINLNTSTQYTNDWKLFVCKVGKERDKSGNKDRETANVTYSQTSAALDRRIQRETIL